MEELERLKAERKRIDEKIRELSNENIDYKRCRIGRATGLPYDTSMVYKLAFNCETASASVRRNIQKTNYRAIMYAEDKKTLIDAIPSIIEDLQGLYELAIKTTESEEEHE